MNKRQSEIHKNQLANEKEALEKLQKTYRNALADIETKLEKLMARNDVDNPNVANQIKYQKNLKKQVQSILKQLQNHSYKTISEFLKSAYENGFIGTMYDLQGQGIPLVIPINPKQVTQAINLETKLSERLYKALGKEMKYLSKQIASAVSSGIASGMTYEEIAKNIMTLINISNNNASRIARTEAHRIQQKATLDAQFEAKKAGADVVKEWDSFLDGATRETHRLLNGQIRELEEPFEVNGMMAMQPGDFGDPAEDCNCRCVLLQRARWNLGNNYTKWDSEAPELIDDESKTQLIQIVSNSYSEFKGIYENIVGQMSMNFDV